MASSTRGYLMPKVGDPNLKRKERNGQAVNPPSYQEMGGFTSAAKIKSSPLMKMEKGGPQAKAGKPI